MTGHNGRSRARPAVRRRRRVVGLLVVVALIAVVGVVLGVTGGRTQRAVSPSACTFASTTASGRYSITPLQAQNAAIITVVAMRQRLPDHAVTVALATSLQETRLQNLPYGDRDSVGLFQQRPSEGWGTRAEILDPNYAATAFYDRLAQVGGWLTLPVTVAAQLVQHSATPNAYAAWGTEARSLAIALTGEVPAGLGCDLHGFGGIAPPASAIAASARTEMGSDLLGVPVSTKTGWEVACWAVAHAYNYHLRSVSFGGWTWTASAGRWHRMARAEADSADHTVIIR